MGENGLQRPAEKPSSPPIRVMIAEGETLFRASVQALVDSEPDMEVVADTGKIGEVPGLIRQQGPKVLILGVETPGLNGLEVLRLLKGERLELRTILMPTREELPKLPSLDQLAVTGIVPKHAGSATLLQAIRAVYEGHKWLRSGARPLPHVQQGLQGLWNHAPRRCGASESPTWARLTPREREVVALVRQGKRYKDIAGRLQISDQTVKNHLRNIFDKLQVKDRVQLALYALEHDL